MTVRQYANNVVATLAQATPSSGAGSTTVTVTTGQGALFPSPGAGQSFTATLVSAGNPNTLEIVSCTSRTGDALTVVRAQEGTSALAWSIGDTITMRPTAGTMKDLVQADQLQTGVYQGAAAGGTANALTATLVSQLVALTDRMQVVLTAAAANTGAATLNLTLGTTVTGALPIVKGGNVALSSGDIPASGYPVVLNYDATLASWVMQNPATSLGGISSGSNGNGYWQKYPTGVIEQWGQVTGVGANSNATVTFPLPSGSGGFQTLASLAPNYITNVTDNVGDSAEFVTSLTVNGMVIRNTTSTGGATLYWRVIGQ